MEPTGTRMACAKGLAVSDWLPIQCDLHSHQATLQIAEETGLDPDAVVGVLIRVWSWAQQRSHNGRIAQVFCATIDRVSGKKGFGEAMKNAGWLEVGDGFVRFPRWEKWLGQGVKRRIQAAKRMAKKRANDVALGAQQDANGLREQGAPTTTSRLRRETKTEDAIASSARRGELPVRTSIRWTTSGWYGITDEDRKAWTSAFPACDIERQLAAMDVWLQANPAKAKKSSWSRFIVNWLTKSQDRGGDVRSNGNAGGHRERRRAAEYGETLTLPITRVSLDAGQGGTSNTPL